MYNEQQNRLIVSVLPAGPFETDFSYICDTECSIGSVVNVPFGKRHVTGVITSYKSYNSKEQYNYDLKSISIQYGITIPKESMLFIDWVAHYTITNRGKILKMVLAEPALFKKKPIECYHSQIQYTLHEIRLSDSQQEAYTKISSVKNKPILLHGVTGSGKTEVYLKAIQDVIALGKQALILFPEIALTQQMISRIEKYFSIAPLIWNSDRLKSERKRIVQDVSSSTSCIVIGSRSALFLPFTNLGIIVVDEEHDSSYKQEEGVLYNARDMAIVRAKLSNIPIILSSATPSLETYANAKVGKYEYVQLCSRFGNSQLPYIDIIDLRQEPRHILISKKLKEQIKNTLAASEQILLYVNRRGYAPITICKECGHKIECPNCSALMVNYKSAHRLMCNYCGYWYDIPQKCHNCSAENSFFTYGAGVEKVYEEVTTLFPTARAIIASSDTMKNEKEAKAVIEKISNHEVDIVIATQILAKGHHFKKLTLVGVIDGDFGIDMADIRASEKNFQLLHQVSGRAGREDLFGKMFIQTFEPKNIIFDMIKNNAITTFLEYETLNRTTHNLPPFCRTVAIIISGNNAELVEYTAKKLASYKIDNATLFGPIPAPILKIRGRTRWRILIKANKNVNVQQKILLWLRNIKYSKAISIQIDVDPINFL